MTLQNDVLNPGPLLNQHPRKACKSMRARVGRPCCGGYPCQPPKMHQISKEVVRDWSLWGSWCFSIFSWFLEIFCDKKMQDVRSFSCMCSCEWCLWMLMIFVMPFYLVFISCSYIMILLVSCCIFFVWTLFREPQHKKNEQPPWPWRQKQDTGAAPDWGTVWTSAGSSEAGCQK